MTFKFDAVFGKVSKFGSAFLLGLSLTACGTTLASERLGGPTVTRVESGELPGPEGQAGRDQVYVYKLGPSDKIIVDVLAIEGLSDRRVVVDGSGNITLPVAGTVQIAGLTLGEAVARLDSQLRASHVRNPQVAINLEEAVSAFVTVDGEVRAPGNYPVLPGLTLMRAVAEAKGPSDYAKVSEVVIRRTVSGQDMIALYDLNGIRRGNYADPVLYPGDTITVGDSPGRRLMQQIISASPLFVTPLVAALSSNY
jgi:polysaccharide export outer membrane protein